MEYTEQEKDIARAIVNDKNFVALLEKVLLSTEVSLPMEVVREKTDKEIGEIYRAISIAEETIQKRWDKLKQLGQSSSGKKSSVPR